MGFFVRYFLPSAWKGETSPPASRQAGWHDERFATERQAIDRGCELVEQGVAIVTVAPTRDDELYPLFIPLDAAGLMRHRHWCLRRMSR
jgi:hypothetical protein